MTRADAIRTLHARHYDTVAEGACWECDLTREVMALRQVVLAVADRIDAANTGVSDERFDRWSDALRSAVYG